MRVSKAFVMALILLSSPSSYAELSSIEFASRIREKTDEFDKTRTVYAETPDFLYSEDSKATCVLSLYYQKSPKGGVAAMMFANFTGDRSHIEITSSKLMIDDQIADVQMEEPWKGKSRTGATEEDVMIFLSLDSFQHIISAAKAKIKFYGNNGSFIYSFGPNERRYLDVFLAYLRTKVLSKS